MFTTSSVLSSVEKGVYAFKIDLQDVYLHVPIHPSSRKYLRFAFENRVYQFQVLPLGLNTAPQVFTRLGHTVTAYLHRQGVSVIPYRDDWLVHHPDRQILLRHQALLIDTLDLVSFILKIRAGPYSGSPGSPRNSLTSGPRESFTHRVQGWGDSRLRAPSILPQGTKLFSSVPPYGFTQLGLRSYPSGSFVPETSSTSFSFVRSDKPVYATAPIRPCGPCQPSAAMAGPTFSYLRNPDPPLSGGLHNLHGRLQSGLGRSHGGFQDFGYLDPYRPQAPHQLSGAQGGYLITCALQHWVPLLHGHQVMIAMDNSTVVSYLYKQGGTRFTSLLRLTVELFLWLESQDIIVRARHIPGCLNAIADHLSHPNQPIPTEWSLHPEMVKRIFRFWGTPEVDMFATLLNSHLPRFMSPVPEPRALTVDALSQDWQGRSMYMFTVHSSGRGDPRSPLVAISTVVPTPTTSLCGTPVVSPIPSRSSVSAGPEVHLRRKVIPSACMEALMRHYKAAGFSDEVSRLAAAPRRPSTNRMYDDRWCHFYTMGCGTRC